MANRDQMRLRSGFSVIETLAAWRIRETAEEDVRWSL